MRTPIVFMLMLALTLGLINAATPAAQESGPSEIDAEPIGRTPPRLSFVDGQVSFYRPGAEDWTQAQVNTPLAPGDQLFTGSPGNLELQIGPRAFVRTWANTQLGFENHEPDYLQFKLTAGHAAFDLRALEPGLTVEVATPNSAFTIDRPGYYRVDVGDQRTDFIARRGGRAMATPEDGEAFSIAPSEEVVIEGGGHPRISSFSAPPLDSWDNWNYARTDRLLEAESARYVVPGIYGAGDLDRHGRWRVVPDYGPIWIPTGVPPGWAPYSTGAWVHDPYYGWSWVDSAPWGWAPYHYGRWVHVGGYWGWAPGPAVMRPVYAPALVAFFGGPQVQVSIGVGAPVMSWVALGWGEPCVPWWGRPGFVRRPWWGGWGGPRVVNNVVVQRTTVINVQEIHVYRNAGVRHAVVTVPRDHFGRGRISPHRVENVRLENLRPMPHGPDVKPSPSALVPREQRGIRPPEKSLKRTVVATRPPYSATESGNREERKPESPLPSSAGARIVQAPGAPKNTDPLPRPPFGTSTIERRNESRRSPQPLPPRVESQRRSESPRELRPNQDGSVSPSPRPSQNTPRLEPPERPRASAPQNPRTPAGTTSATQRFEAPRSPQSSLPGEPASRLSPSRARTLDSRSLEGVGKPSGRGEPRDAPPAARRPSPSGDAGPNPQRSGAGPYAPRSTP
jgi:hypothetical protein